MHTKPKQTIESLSTRQWRSWFKREPTPAELASSMEIARRADAHWKKEIDSAIERGEVVERTIFHVKMTS